MNSPRGSFHVNRLASPRADRRARPFSRGRRRGFSLIETLICILIVGVSLVASMQVVGAAIRQRGSTNDTMVGTLLAQELISEVLACSYREPTGTAVFGPETGENQRSIFDDLDDYHGWTESPPKNQDGTNIDGLAGWTRSVTVEQVSSSDAMVTNIRVSGTSVGHGLRTGSASDSGIKRVTVTLTKNGVTIVTLKAVRTDAWPGY